MQYYVQKLTKKHFDFREFLAASPICIFKLYFCGDFVIIDVRTPAMQVFYYERS